MMFNPYLPNAFAIQRTEVAKLPPGQIRAGILRLLDRLESDPELCWRWWQHRRRQEYLYRRFGPEELMHPPECAQKKLREARN